MDNTDKRIKETIESMPDSDLYSIGDAQKASIAAKGKAYKLQKEAEGNKDEHEEEA